MQPPNLAEAPNPIRSQDANVLIGLLAEFEGYLMAGELDEYLVNPFRKRFVQAGLIGDDSDERGLRQAVSDLNQRLRYTVGEYPEPVAQFLVPPSGNPKPSKMLVLCVR